MTETVSLVRREGPWGWDAAGTRYLCADGGEAGTPDPDVMAFLQSHLAALPAAVVKVEAVRGEAEAGSLALSFADAGTAAQARVALAEHLLLVSGPENNRFFIRPGAGFSRQNAALLVEMLSEIMLDISPAAPMW